LRLSEIDEPKPAHDEVLIDVHAASVSFMDQLMVSGLYQMRPPTPFVPGTEASGIVAAVGDEVTALAPGDRVACSAWTGGYAERMIAKDSKCVRLPEGVAFEAAALLVETFAFGLQFFAAGIQLSALGFVGPVAFIEQRPQPLQLFELIDDEFREAISAGAEFRQRRVDVLPAGAL